MKDDIIDLDMISISVDGSVVLTDDDLSLLEKDAEIIVAGGDNGQCHGINFYTCTNDESCSNSTNLVSCSNQYGCTPGGESNWVNCHGAGAGIGTPP